MMNKIIIISSDPDTSRMLQLALDIKDYNVSLAQNTSELDINAANCKIVILDMDKGYDQSLNDWKAISTSNKRAIIILPRGKNSKRLNPKIRKGDLVVNRPFELGFLIDMIERAVKKS